MLNHIWKFQLVIIAIGLKARITMSDLIDREEAIKVISNDSLDVKRFCVIGRDQDSCMSRVP